MVETTTARGQRPPSRVRRVAVIAAGLALAIAIPATALAGKGAGGSTSSPWIALASVDGATSLAAAQPAYGSVVRFASGYPSSTKNPWVSLICYQDGSLVYAEGNVPGADFSLGGGGSVWEQVGGAASCRAELGDLYWRGGRQHYTFLASTSFDAGP